MIILTAIIIHLIIDRRREIKFRDHMIEERDHEIVKLRTEMWNLKVELLNSNTGKDFSYLKEKDESQ